MCFNTLLNALTHFKSISIQVFFCIFCASFFLSCHSDNKVVSSYGKRKYRKGWFWFKHKDLESKPTAGKDTGLTHNYPLATKPSGQSTASSGQSGEVQEQSPHKKHHHHANKDSLKAAAKIASATVDDKSKTKPPKDPPDGFDMQILVLIMVLAAISILFTGLITPILVWGITQDFLLSVGVVFTLMALIASTNTKLAINAKHNEKAQYNIGKPAWIISLLAAIPVAILYLTVKHSVTSFYQIATVGLFIAGACIIVSLVLAVKALFVHDRHKGKAVIAILMDALLIAIIITLLP